jgi:hypothetical protein
MISLTCRHSLSVGRRPRRPRSRPPGA